MLAVVHLPKVQEIVDGRGQKLRLLIAIGIGFIGPKDYVIGRKAMFCGVIKE